jgi:hypothetical protein
MRSDCFQEFCLSSTSFIAVSLRVEIDFGSTFACALVRNYGDVSWGQAREANRLFSIFAKRVVRIFASEGPLERRGGYLISLEG